MEKEKGYWLPPLTKGRCGYLVFYPRQPIVWIDEQFQRCWKIQIRASASLYEKKTVLAASFDTSDGVLRLEDALYVRGVDIRKKPFTQRWDDLCDIYRTSYREDTQLQDGLQVTIASYTPLSSASTWNPIPQMMLWQPEHASRKLRVQISSNQTLSHPHPQHKDQTQPRPQPQQKDQTQPRDQTRQRPQEKPEPEESSPFHMNAIPHEEYPDTYTLFQGTVKKGYAAVQDFALSQQLKHATKEKDPLRVKVQWNEEFSMYEIISILESE